MFSTIATVALGFGSASARFNEVWNQKQTEAAGIVWRGNHTTS